VEGSSGDTTDWQAQARCRELSDSELSKVFHLGRGQKTTAAKEFCSGCLVERQCFLSAIANNEVGVWAGTSDKERAQIRKFINELEYVYFKREPVQVEDLFNVGTTVTVEVTDLGEEEEDSDSDSYTSLFELPEPTDAELIALEAIVDLDQLPDAG
jgi:hypothetical protein